MAKRHHYKTGYKEDGPTIIETVLVGFFKALWWLATLPFHKGKKRGGLSADDIQYVVSKRQEIEKMCQSDSIYELRHAVIEADKLFDFVLKKKGYTGETFADRLRNAEKYMDSAIYQSIWDAHKVRNTVAHSQEEISAPHIKSAINRLLNGIKY
ncbi:MAG: hypothetical protein BWY19_00164 [bacterium ADurb.Bin212]|nr:MAG: hypothetical protein BWY19_00164 [bacterium ADurb.Bin212]